MVTAMLDSSQNGAQWCGCMHDSPALMQALDPSGNVLAFGGRKGSVQLYQMPEEARSGTAGRTVSATLPGVSIKHETVES